MNSDKFFLEGKELMQKGEGYTKRTLTRWSPDWNLAAAAFENAQKKFTAAGKKYSEFQISAALRAADAYEELNSLNSAAKMVEKATFVMDGAGITSSKSREDAVKLARRAGDLYRANGQSDKASALYAKGAEILGDEDVKASLELFQEALDCYLAENKEVLSHDCFKKAIAFAIKVEEFEYAIRWLQQDAEIYHKQGSTSGHRNILGIIILHLYRKDLENASNVLASADPGFMRSDEFPAAEDLIDAYKSGDEEKFSNAKNNRALKYVDISIARLVKSLVLEPQPVLDAEVDLNADFSMADGASAVQLEKKEVDGEIDLT